MNEIRYNHLRTFDALKLFTLSYICYNWIINRIMPHKFIEDSYTVLFFLSSPPSSLSTSIGALDDFCEMIHESQKQKRHTASG